MLIIARRKGQRISIGHDVEVVVTELSRGMVKLGIVAPAERTILRGEIRDAVEEANRAAIGTSLETSIEAPAAPDAQAPVEPKSA